MTGSAGGAFSVGGAFSKCRSVTARYAISSGFASGLIHSSTSCSRIISGIRSWIKEISSHGDLVSTTKWGSPSSNRYSPQSQVIWSPFGWIRYLSPVSFLPFGRRKCSRILLCAAVMVLAGLGFAGADYARRKLRRPRYVGKH